MVTQVKDKQQFILHIGCHKTGTTSVQAHLAGNREALLSQGIDYPLFGRVPGTGQVHRYISAWFRGLPKEYPPGTGETIASGFSEAPRCILSSEDFYFIHRDEQIAAIASSFGGPARVICVMREPVSHLVSMYKESLRGSLKLTLAEFAQQHREAMLKPGVFSYYSYDGNMSRWRRHHDAVALEYRRDGMVGAVLEAAGLHLAPGTVKPPQRRNETIPDAVMALKLAVNRQFASRHLTDECTMISRRLYELARDKLLPDASQFCDMRPLDMRGFIETFRQSNPEFAHLAAESPETVSVPVPNMDDREAVAILRDLAETYCNKNGAPA